MSLDSYYQLKDFFFDSKNILIFYKRIEQLEYIRKKIKEGIYKNDEEKNITIAIFYSYIIEIQKELMLYNSRSDTYKENISMFIVDIKNIKECIEKETDVFISNIYYKDDKFNYLQSIFFEESIIHILNMRIQNLNNIKEDLKKISHLSNEEKDIIYAIFYSNTLDILNKLMYINTEFSLCKKKIIKLIKKITFIKEYIEDNTDVLLKIVFPHIQEVIERYDARHHDSKGILHEDIIPIVNNKFTMKI